MSLKDLEDYYNNEKLKSCISLFKGNFNQIVLIRHGEPDIEKLNWYTREKVIQYSMEYDNVGVKSIRKIPVCLESIHTENIYHSDLPRSTHTAELLFNEKFNLIADRRFREFQKSIFRFLNFPLPLKFWTTISRILWFLGVNDPKIESIREAKLRAKANAIFLSEKSKTDNMVIVVAHGWLNRYMRKYLQKNEWKLVYDEGDGYLALKILAREQ